MFQFILHFGACEKIFTAKLRIVYSKLTIIALGPCKIGKIKQSTININPEYIKMVTIGETIVVAIIPIGQKVPKILSEIGAVKICAPVEADSEEEMYCGNIFE